LGGSAAFRKGVYLRAMAFKTKTRRFA